MMKNMQAIRTSISAELPELPSPAYSEGESSIASDTQRRLAAAKANKRRGQGENIHKSLLVRRESKLGLVFDRDHLLAPLIACQRRDCSCRVEMKSNRRTTPGKHPQRVQRQKTNKNFKPNQTKPNQPPHTIQKCALPGEAGRSLSGAGRSLLSTAGSKPCPAHELGGKLLSPKVKGSPGAVTRGGGRRTNKQGRGGGGGA